MHMFAHHIAYYCTLMCTIVHHCILFDITRPPLHITVPMHMSFAHYCPLLPTIAHLSTLVCIPSLQGVVEFSLAFFFVKMVNYVFKAWLPFYIATNGTPYPHICAACGLSFNPLITSQRLAGDLLVGSWRDGCPPYLMLVVWWEWLGLVGSQT